MNGEAKDILRSVAVAVMILVATFLAIVGLIYSEYYGLFIVLLAVFAESYGVMLFKRPKESVFSRELLTEVAFWFLGISLFVFLPMSIVSGLFFHWVVTISLIALLVVYWRVFGAKINQRLMKTILNK